MTTTPNLLIEHIAANQAQKEVTANAAFDALDKALCQLTSIAIADVDTTLTDAQMLGRLSMKFTGTLTAGRTITIPRAKLLMVENATTGGFILGENAVRYGNFAQSATESCFIATVRPFRSLPILAVGRHPLRYRRNHVGGNQQAARLYCVIRYHAPCAFRPVWPAVAAWPEQFQARPPHFLSAKTARSSPPCSSRLGSALPTFTAASDTDFAAGDVLTIIAPSPADSTLADIGFALAGIRL
jgi:hypothetical protein